MTTEINAAKSAGMTPAFADFSNELSEETKIELQELGVTVTADMTEAEAAEIIEAKEVQEEPEPQSVMAVALNTDIKNLAAVVGLAYESTDTPDEILAAIADELEAQIDEAENNPQALSTLMGYFHQLSSLDAQLDEIKHGETKLFSAMDMMAHKNREEFGF